MWNKLKNLRIPVIAAPMFMVSNPKMAIECCKAGIVGSFPAHFPRTREKLSEWIDEMEAFYKENPAMPFAVNLVTHRTNKRYEGDLDLCVERQIPIILSSKGAPGETCRKVHEYGGLVFHDVASRRHAEKALEAGVDGLIAVAGGAGGHSGTINPFALVNEIRQITDKPIILGGSISTGQDILAAQAMGATYAYMGTRFICTQEASTKNEGWKQAIVESKTGKDIILTSALDGSPSNWMKKSLADVGVDLLALENTPKGQLYDGAKKLQGRYGDIYSAGHGTAAINDIPTVANLVANLEKEYEAAKIKLKAIL